MENLNSCVHINKLCDFCIQAPSTCTPRIQETHIVIGHIICAIV